MRADGAKVGVFRPLTLSPFPEQALCGALQGRKALVVELSAGQFRDDVVFRMASACGHCVTPALCNRMGGVIVTVNEVLEQARTLLRR